jgi:hypothetical protein
LRNFLLENHLGYERSFSTITLSQPRNGPLWDSVNWPELYGEADDEYLELLRQCPERLRDYRKSAEKRGAKSALFGVPSIAAGAPRKDWLAQECWKLLQAGLSQLEIARELNLRHPNLKDKKGNPRPVTKEVVRKQLASFRKKNTGKNLT